ncbi:MAG: hypothetical protein ACT4NU_02725 [Chromatiales bacterium]
MPLDVQRFGNAIVSGDPKDSHHRFLGSVLDDLEVVLLFPAIDQMLMAAHVICKIFGLDVKDKFEIFSHRSRELSEDDEAREDG